jgi:hypothetical protein
MHPRTPATARTRTASTPSSAAWPPDLSRAVFALGGAIDAQEWPKSTAYEVVRFLVDAYQIHGVVHDPDDERFMAQAIEHLAEAHRVISAEVQAWDRVVPLAASLGDDVPF